MPRWSRSPQPSLPSRRPSAHITYLRHPTTGGVFASWGSLGHVTVAEPAARSASSGRVYENALRSSFPDGVQTAENLYANGLLDVILPVDELTATAERLLDLVLAHSRGIGDPRSEPTPWPDIPA